MYINVIYLYIYNRWYIGDKVLSSGADERYIYLRIENSMHKKQLKCDTKNDVSTQTATYTIEVTC